MHCDKCIRIYISPLYLGTLKGLSALFMISTVWEKIEFKEGVICESRFGS